MDLIPSPTKGERREAGREKAGLGDGSVRKVFTLQVLGALNLEMQTSVSLLS